MISSPRRRAGEQKTFGEKGVPLTKKVFAAWRAYQHEHHDRALLQPRSRRSKPSYALLHQASPKNARNRWHRQFANNLLKIWPALWTFAMIDGIGADRQSRRARAPRPGHPPKSRARHAKQQRQAVRERAHSAAATCRMQRRSLFTYLSELITTPTRSDPFPALT